MRVALATSPGRPGWANEDFVAAVPTAVVLLDGAGISGIEEICRHGVAWYTHRLGGALIGRLSRAGGQSDRGQSDGGQSDGGQSLATMLGDAIEEVTDDHRGTCDVTDPSSPSATVVLFRVNGDRADYLVLADSFLVLEQADGGTRVITDEREVAIRHRYTAPMYAAVEGTPEYERARAVAVEAFRASRNQPGGFWVAKNDPRAANEAVVNSVPTRDLASVTLLSNGASRIVDRFGLADWPEVVALLGTAGPAEIIRRVRAAEANTDQHRGGEVSDDATVAYCTDLQES